MKNKGRSTHSVSTLKSQYILRMWVVMGIRESYCQCMSKHMHTNLLFRTMKDSCVSWPCFVWKYISFNLQNQCQTDSAYRHTSLLWQTHTCMNARRHTCTYTHKDSHTHSHTHILTHTHKAYFYDWADLFFVTGCNYHYLKWLIPLVNYMSRRSH